jgi:Flp pilus assembly protein TadG
MRILSSRRSQRRNRNGAAAVEFAMAAPVLFFIFAIGVDFARAFYAHLIITNASRNAALYACDNPTTASDTAGITAAALNDTTDLANVTVTTGNYIDATDGNQYVWVTVSYPFQTLTSFPGVPSETIYQSTVIRVEPTTPRPGSYGY